MTIDYHTYVNHLTATPLGLLPERWKLEHRCSRCHQRVEPEHLIAHTRQHGEEVVPDN